MSNRTSRALSLINALKMCSGRTRAIVYSVVPVPQSVRPKSQPRKAVFWLSRTAIPILAGFCSGMTCWAGSYSLVEGMGQEVCEAYQRNLEPRHDAEPMVCEREYDPHIKEFKMPRWRKVDVSRHLAIYAKALRYMWENHDSPVGAQMAPEDINRGTTIEAVRAKALYGLSTEMYVTELRLRSRGPLSTVLAIRERRCGTDSPTSRLLTSLYVVNKSLTDLDYHMQRYWGNGNNMTLVLYKGVPFLESYQPDDNWAHAFSGKGALYVQPAGQGNDARLQCVIAFWPDSASK